MTSDKPMTAEEILIRNRTSTEHDVEYNLSVLKFNMESRCITPKTALLSMEAFATQQTEALRKKNERLYKMVMELGEYTPNGYIRLKAKADKLAEALELIKDTAKCTDDRFASMSDYIYHLCESSLNEYKTK